MEKSDSALSFSVDFYKFHLLVFIKRNFAPKSTYRPTHSRKSSEKRDFVVHTQQKKQQPSGCFSFERCLPLRAREVKRDVSLCKRGEKPKLIGKKEKRQVCVGFFYNKSEKVHTMTYSELFLRKTENFIDFFRNLSIIKYSLDYSEAQNGVY